MGGALCLLARDQFKVFNLGTPRSGKLRTQKLKSHLVTTQSLNVLPLKPRVAQYKPTMLRLLPGISSLLTSTLPVHSPAFFQNLSRCFPALAVANTGSCVGSQNKIGRPAGCIKIHDLCYDDL